MLLSGKEFDHRNPEFTNELKRKVVELGLIDNIKFLGFLDINEMLQLMNNSVAIIQPSLFEGWSTAIEDAKALNKFVIASNINVHKEQLINNYALFKAGDFADLAAKILNFIKNEPTIIKNNYQDNVRDFASGFYQIMINEEA